MYRTVAQFTHSIGKFSRNVVLIFYTYNLTSLAVIDISSDEETDDEHARSDPPPISEFIFNYLLVYAAYSRFTQSLIFRPTMKTKTLNRCQGGRPTLLRPTVGFQLHPELHRGRLYRKRHHLHTIPCPTSRTLTPHHWLQNSCGISMLVRELSAALTLQGTMSSLVGRESFRVRGSQRPMQRSCSGFLLQA